MNPNGDAYVTNTGLPFPNQNGYYTNDFEVKMFGIPKLGGDASRDNIGDPCGITDLIPDLDDPNTTQVEGGYSVYARRFKDANNNIMFRFRVGNNNPSVEAWTILLDVDGKFGFTGTNADPNATPDNPGFELDITLIKRSNAGVLIFNIDGTEKCGTALKTYGITGTASHFQIAVADITTCGDLDYFYDIFVPFNEVANLFNTATNNIYGLTGLTPLRYAAVTNTSATCAMDGKIADVSGINDNDPQYASIPYAFEQIINSQCGTPIEDLRDDGPGFNTQLPYSPTINPVKSGGTVVSGTVISTAVPPITQANIDDIFVQVSIFSDAGVLRQPPIVAPVTDGLWSATLTSPLQPYDVIRARVQLNEEGTGCGTGAGNEATFKVLVVPDFAFTTNEDTPLTASLNPNNANLGQNPVFSPGTTGAMHGIVTINADGTFTYTPNANYNGEDEFKYILCADIDEEGDPECGEATVKITVTAVNDAPDAINDTGTDITEDGANGSVNIISNDIDVDGNPTAPVNGSGQFTLDLDPNTAGLQTTFNSNGVWTLDINTGIVTYDPASNFFGTATIFYTLCDPTGACDPQSASITFNVTAVNNDPPVANDDAGATLVEDGDNGTINIIANDTDPDGNPQAPLNTAGQFSIDLDLVTPQLQSSFTNTVGTWTLNTTTGVVTFNPADNYYGVASITYRLTDPQGLFDDAIITFNVSPLTDAPIAIDDNGGNIAGNTVNGTVNVLTNDSDPDILPNGVIPVPVNGSGQYSIDLDVNTPGVQSSFTNSAGVWTLNINNGVVTFDAAASHVGSASITYRLCDPENNCDTAIIQFIVLSSNTAPVAVNDVITTNEDVAVTFNIVTNTEGSSDTDPDPGGSVNPATVDLNPSTPAVEDKTITTAQGTYTVDNVGNLTFQPALNYTGQTNPIFYTVKDNLGALSNQASIIISVLPINDPPVALNVTVNVPEDAIDFLIGLNGSDPDGDVISYIIVSEPSNGTRKPVSGSNVPYSPTPDYYGNDSFTYKVRDASGLESQVATVFINVTRDINDAPVAQNQFVTVIEDQSKDIFLGASDADGDPLTYSIVTPPANGTLGIINGNKITYTPFPGYTGADSFTFRVNDGTVFSAPATITIEVVPVNDAPVAFDKVVPYATVAVPFTLEASDPEGNTLTYTVLTTPPGGRVTGTAPNLTFTPQPGDNSTFTLTFQVNDGSNNSRVATVWFVFDNLVNDPPVAEDDQVELDEDTQESILLLATDPDGNALTFAIVSGPSSGTLTPTSDPRIWIYKPNLNYHGPDAFTFRATDGGGLFDEGVIDITVRPINDPPVANNQTIVYAVNADTPVTLTGSDVDGDAITFTVLTQPAFGTLTGSGSGYTYTPNTNYNGPDKFTFKVTDSKGVDSQIATVSLVSTLSNVAPVAFNQSLTMQEDGQVTISLSATDINGDPITFTILTDALLNGTLSCLNCASPVYKPTLNYNGTASFRFKVNDGTIDSNEATVTITITPVQDKPVANSQTVNVPENTDTTIDLSAFDVDDNMPDPVTLTYTIITLPTHGTLSCLNCPNPVYTPDPDYVGPDSFTFKVNDGIEDSEIATVTINVTNVNKPPVAVNDVFSTEEDVTGKFNLVNNNANSSDTDPDGIVIPSTVDLNPATPAVDKTFAVTGEGTYTVDNNGELTFTPSLNFNGLTTAIKYTVKDNEGALSNEATIQVNVTPVNDAPVVNDANVTVNEDESVTVCVTYTDVEGDPAVLTGATSQSGKGTVTLDPASGPLCFIYTPEHDFNGSDNVPVVICDKNDPTLCSTGTITIIINPVNDPPRVIIDGQPVDKISLTTPEDTPLPFCFDADDLENDQISVGTITNVSGGGTLVPGSGSSGNTFCFVFTPEKDFTGKAIWTISICDDGNPSLCKVITVEIEVTPEIDPPVALDQTVTTDEDTPKAITLQATDPDGDDLTYLVITNPTNGSLSGTAPNLTYTPNLNYNGSDSFTFRANDGTFNSNVATVTIQVNAMNDPAVFSEIPVIYVPEDSVVQVCIGAIDPEGDGLTYNNPTNVSGGGTMTRDASFEFCFNFRPVKDYNGESNWKFPVCDNGTPTMCSEKEVKIIVTPVNDPPVAVNDFIEAMSSKQTDKINILTNDRDIENDRLVLTTTPLAGPYHGTIKMYDDGNIEYKSALGYMGADSVRYKVCDTGDPSLCDEGVVFIEVGPAPFKIYEGLSPNGDGLNDYWRIDGIEAYPDNTVRVFDRYNNLIFEMKGYDNEQRSWTGQSNHSLVKGTMPEGTYYYIVDLGDGSELYKGYVVLKRN